MTQNREKYLATGNPCSVFSASAGGTCLKHPVVFGTPLTVLNSIAKFGSKFCAVVVDEAHGITPTIKEVISVMQESNPYLRVIGLSGTPYRMGTGYIYRQDEKNNVVKESIDPYFMRLVFKIQARNLIDRGYLTPPAIGEIHAGKYETETIELNAMHRYDAADIDRAFVGKGRKTARIVADVIDQSRDRQGVMFFAQTIAHAQEIMESLPPALSKLVTGKTGKVERKAIIDGFKGKEFKYLVNVDVLTKGFDAPHVDVIAILRLTESVALLQQIIGRGLRTNAGKSDCLVLDYAGNIDRHCPDGDVFSPNVSTSKKSSESAMVTVECEDCLVEQEFSARPNPDAFHADKNGYFVDLYGHRIVSEDGYIPAHFGRRCQAYHLLPNGTMGQCEYRWTFKSCLSCSADNDISARRCVACGAEIVDPNSKLKADFEKRKKDPTQVQTDKVINMRVVITMSRRELEMYKIDWLTEYRSFSTWVFKNPENTWQAAELSKCEVATNRFTKMPATITYRKDAATGFYKILSYNGAPDEVSKLA